MCVDPTPSLPLRTVRGLAQAETPLKPVMDAILYACVPWSGRLGGVGVCAHTQWGRLQVGA